MAGKLFGIKLVGQFLCFVNIADERETIVVHCVSDVVRVKNSFHQFPAIYVDGDGERKPCLKFYKHETVNLIQIIKIIVETFPFHILHFKLMGFFVWNYGKGIAHFNR